MLIWIYFVYDYFFKLLIPFSGKIITMNLPETTESISDMRKQLNPARFLQALCLLIQQEQPCYIHSHAKENEPKIRCDMCHALSKTFPESAFDLVNRLLDPNPHTRITASEALHHPFITNEMPYYNSWELILISYVYLNFM